MKKIFTLIVLLNLLLVIGCVQPAEEVSSEEMEINIGLDELDELDQLDDELDEDFFAELEELEFE